MNDLRKLRAIALSCICILSLAGCGGGGGGGGGGSAPAASTTVSGVASKGLIKNGVNNVKIWALTSGGTKGALLATASTGPSGEYSADVGSYAGAVLVEASGTYSDEATGQPVTISPTSPLRAAYDNVAGNATVAVTPLTELAVQKAGALTTNNIKAANAEVSSFFNVDIVATKPVDASAAALGASGVSAAQKNYTLALAAISQMATSATPDAVYAVIAKMQTDNDPSKTAGEMTKAMEDFTANSYNKTGVTSSNIPAVMKLSVSGTSENIYGIEVTVDLPPGVTVVAEADGLISADVLSLVGSAAGNSTMKIGKRSPASGATPAKLHILLVSASANGFGIGEFVAIKCAVAQWATPKFSNSMIESGASILSADGTQIGGAAVTLSAAL